MFRPNAVLFHILCKIIVRASELMLKRLHLSLSPSFTFTWNLNRKMSRKSQLTGNGNLTFAVCINGNLNLSNIDRNNLTCASFNHTQNKHFSITIPALHLLA